MKSTPIIAILFFLTSTGALASGCGSYPYTSGMSVEKVPGGVKIIATGSASVMFGTVSAVNSARQIATLRAKSMISNFLIEGIHDHTTVKNVVDESSRLKGKTRQAERTKVITIIEKMSSNSAALLRGVVPLGSCYTKGQEVRVSVGIKPQTINDATNLSRNISSSRPHLSANTTNESKPENQADQPSFNHDKELKKF